MRMSYSYWFVVRSSIKSCSIICASFRINDSNRFVTKLKHVLKLNSDISISEIDLRLFIVEYSEASELFSFI